MSHKLRESLRACRLAAQYLLGRPSYQTRTYLLLLIHFVLLSVCTLRGAYDQS